MEDLGLRCVAGCRAHTGFRLVGFGGDFSLHCGFKRFKMNAAVAFADFDAHEKEFPKPLFLIFNLESRLPAKS